MIKKRTHEKAKEQLFTKTGHVLISEYIEYHGKVKFICGNCGEKTEKKFINALFANTCSHCQIHKGSRKLSQKEAEEILLKRNYILLSRFKRSGFKVEVQCLKCKIIQQDRFNNFIKRLKCSECKI